MAYTETNQLWITLGVATDTLPLLVNCCSKECEHQLPKPPKNYIRYPHKGGVQLEQPQPTFTERHYKQKVSTIIDDMGIEEIDAKKPELLKVIWKIWEK